MTAVDPVTATHALSGSPRVALVHDFLVSRGGAERVALAMARTFPDAAIHTALHEPDATFDGFRDHEIRPLPIDSIPALRRHHRWSLPLLQHAFAKRVVVADVVLCSSSGFAHHVATSGAKVVYCHTPARWLHDQDRYLDRFGPVSRAGARVLTRPALRRDSQAMITADRILANSTVIGDQIRETYGRTPTVLAPCSSLAVTDDERPIRGIAPGFVLCPSRALGYKRLDVLLDAAERLPGHRFVQVGDGPDLARLRAIAPDNVLVLGEVSDAELRWAYRNASIVALTSAEDFGLVPLEASAHGLMSVVPRARGFLDHVREAENGWFYEFGDAAGLAAVIALRSDTRGTAPGDDPLGERRFSDALRAVVEEAFAR